MKKLIALMTIFFFLFCGCATTIIKTKPSGAKVYMDGEIKGETPHIYSSAGIWGTKKMVVLKKEGYKDNVGQIKKNKVNWVTVIIGLFIYPLLLWGADFEPEYTFELEKIESKPSDLPIKPQVTAPEKPITSAPITPSPGATKKVEDIVSEKKKISFYSFEEIKEWHNAVKDREWKKISESEGITLCYDTRNISYPSKGIFRVYTLATYESKNSINDKINLYRQLVLSTKVYEYLYGTLTLQEIYCNNKIYLPIYFMDYDKNRNPLNQSYDLSSNGWSEISSTVPTLEKLYKVVCPGGK